MPYIITLQVRKFHQSTINRFGTAVEFFNSPSEKRHELTKIRRCECNEIQDWEREQMIRSSILTRS